MKKSSFQRANRFGRSVRYTSPAGLRVGAIAIAVLLVVWGLRAVFPDAFTALLTPLWRTGSAVSAGVGNAGTFFDSKDTLVRERAKLQQENEGLRAQNEALLARTQDLTKLLGTRTEALPGVLAGVLARPPVSPYDVLVIDRGTDEGVATGAHVYGNGGTPLGTVGVASEHSSRVLLYSAPGRESSAWVGQARVPVTLLGQGSGAFSAQVPRDAVVLVGDEVYIEGPGALPVGRIIEVISDPSAPKSTLRIKPITNIFSTTWVTVSTSAAL